MELRIFDVSHGFCSLVASDNGGLVLIDCGHDSGGFTPSRFLSSVGHNNIHHFIISNFDQDHVSDLHNLLQNVNIHVFHRNPTVSPEYIRALKLQSGPLTNAMGAAISCATHLVHPVNSPPDMGDLEIQTFCNRYPEFTDTNNLSVVTFIKFENFTVLFPGDLEEAGWLGLMRNPSFLAKLATVNVFVASHHGRSTGYCAEIFEHCRPDVVVISDKGILHDTQQHNLYPPHVAGLVWPGNIRRQVLTTRNDGTIRIVKPRGENYLVYLNQ